MKWLKLFEDFGNDSETLVDLFLDVKDKYSLTEIAGDPFHGRGSMHFKKENFPVGNSFYVRKSPNLLKEDEENGYFSIAILLSVDVVENRTGPNRYKAPPSRSILINHYPEFLHDIGKYEKSVDSFVKMLGYKSRSGELITFRQCQDFGVIEAIFNFTISEYRQKNHQDTENFLKRIYGYDMVGASNDPDMVAKLKKLGYNI